MTSHTLPNGSAPCGGVTNDATARLPDHADYRATRTNANSAFVRTTRLSMSIHVQSGLGSYLPLHGPERGHRNADNKHISSPGTAAASLPSVGIGTNMGKLFP